MAVGGFRAGQLLNWRAANYVIERLISGERWQLRNLETNEISSHELFELLRAYEVGDLIFQSRATVDTDPDVDLKRLLERSLRSFSEADVAHARRLEHYCIAIDSDNFQSLDPIALQPFIDATAKKLCDPNPPRVTTLYRAYKNWIQVDKDLRGLIPQHWNKGNREAKLPRESLDIVEASIQSVLNHKEDRTSKVVHDEVAVRITALNKQRAEDAKLPIPSERTVRTRISALPTYDLAKMRYGKRHADLEFRTSLRGPEATAPLERVEFDFTPSDAILIDDTIGLPIGRCTTASTIDCHTGCCTAAEVFPDFPNSANCLTTLSQAIRPKTWLREEYPNVKYDWHCCGVPNMVVFDNPWELIGKQIEQACVDLKFDIVFAPPRTGYYKGQIERFQKTTNFTLLHPAKGTTLSNYLKLIDYDPRKNALITLQEYKAELYRWIVDVYNRTKRGKPCFIPVERWREAMSRKGISLPASAASLLPVIGLNEDGTVQHYGLQYKYIRYNSQVLGDIRRMFGNKLRLKFIINPQNLGSIQVIHPRDGIYITVPAVVPEYADNLKLYQHLALIKAAEIEARQKVDELELAHIRNEICRSLSGELTKKNSRMKRNKLFVIQAELQSRKPAPPRQAAKRPDIGKATSDTTENYQMEWM